MRWQKDEVDLWCEDWAKQRRRILGILELEPKERIGRLKSTLGTIREERDGASQGTAKQSFPEVYIGPAPNFPLLVNRAWKEMRREWRPIIQVHYCCLYWDVDGERVRVKAKEKAALLDVELPLYWKYMTFAKNYIHGFVTISTKYESERVYSQNTAAIA